MLRFVLRSVLLVAIVVGFLAAREHGAALASRLSRRALRVLSIRLDQPVRLGWHDGLIIANHLSWLDALVLIALQPAAFVTSVEVENSPGLGTFCKKGGCLFVERRRVGGLAAEGQRIAATLASTPVVIFPEATSSDGSQVLPFRPAAFAWAAQAGATIRPVCLRYLRIGDRAIDRRNGDRVHWHGDMDFLPHLIGVLTLPGVKVAVRALPVLPLTADRKALAAQGHARISAAWRELQPS